VAPRTVTSRKRAGRTPAGPDFPLAEGDLPALSRQTGEPAWHAERPLSAWKTYQGIPMPGPTHEAWRRTDIRALPFGELRLKAAEDAPVDPALLRPPAREGWSSGRRCRRSVGHPGRGLSSPAGYW